MLAADMQRLAAWSWLLGGVLAGCAEAPAQHGTIEVLPLAARRGAAGPLFGALEPERSGIAFESRFEWEHPHKHLYAHGFAGGGVCAGDVDGDGLPELYLTGQTGSDRLYRNLGGLRFEDVTAAAGLGDRTWSAGATFGDVDGDGDLDLFVCSYDAPNRLWVNGGDGTFREQAAARGLDFSGASIMGAFADCDLDGDLDLYLVTNRLYPGPVEDYPRTRRVDGRVEIEPGWEQAYALQERDIDGELQKYVVKAGQRDRLYRNDGRGRFVEVALEAGISGNQPGLSAIWWDFDDDGLPDIYVSNDFWDADRLYRNLGDGTFADQIERAPSTPWFSMGADLGDLDGDGRVDLLAADMSPTTHYRAKIMMGSMGDSRWFLESAEPRQYMRNHLFLATGVEHLLEAARIAGLDSTDWTWSVKLGDLDLDGRVDAFFTNGSANHTFDPDFTRRLAELSAEQTRRGLGDPERRAAEQWQLYRQMGVRRERDLAFRNADYLRFEDVSAEWGVDHSGVSFGATLADLDRDGDLDLVVNRVGDPAGVYENRSDGGHAIVVRLVGRGSNSAGLGALVELDPGAGGPRQVRQITTTRGYMSADEPLAHFGLAQAGAASALTVRWPSGHVQRLRDASVDRLYVFTEPEGEPAGARREPAPPPRFREVSRELGLDLCIPVGAHDDYARQPLLPAALSRAGPCLAWGDADGDGDDDLFVGGPAGEPGRLLLRGERRFAVAPGPWDADAGCDDAGALWVDFDSDGDLDLFVASGGVALEDGHPALADRLYVADGRGAFERASREVLPELRAASSAVAAADLEGDGDLDLFVGGRSLPGAYPLAAASRLLRNDGGHFVDATHDVAPGLARAGMVTGALWSDVELDGDPDLLLTLEWGPVALWVNAGGRLEDATAGAGLAERTGWWTGLSAADVDGDGDQDYVVGNAGLNTKYRASPGRPATLFFGDFEGAGRENLVEAKRADDGLLPVRGLSCSAGAMPSVAQRMPSYHDFASASLDQIYPGGVLDAALLLEATELASGLLLNESGTDGPRLRWEQLPRAAQVSVLQGSAAADLDGDGRTDVAGAQNFYWREPETGRWNGGLGLLLRPGAARPLVPHAASGLVIAGDARALTVAELDGDGRPDLVVSRNDQPLLAFVQPQPAGAVEAEGLRTVLRLAGPPGNPACVGARVTTPAGTTELAAGSGVLSQNPPLVFVRRGDELRVRWPDGSESSHSASEPRMVLRMPERP